MSLALQPAVLIQKLQLQKRRPSNFIYRFPCSCHMLGGQLPWLMSQTDSLPDTVFLVDRSATEVGMLCLSVFVLELNMPQPPWECRKGSCKTWHYVQAVVYFSVLFS